MKSYEIADEAIEAYDEYMLAVGNGCALDATKADALGLAALKACEAVVEDYTLPRSKCSAYTLLRDEFRSIFG